MRSVSERALRLAGSVILSNVVSMDAQRVRRFDLQV